jgi:hypothetical protein
MSCRRPVYDAFVMATAFASVFAMGCVNSESGEASDDGDSAQSSTVVVDTLNTVAASDSFLGRFAVKCADGKAEEGACGSWEDDDGHWSERCFANGAEKDNGHYAPWDSAVWVTISYVCVDHHWYAGKGFKDDDRECHPDLIAASTLTPNGVKEAVCCQAGHCGVAVPYTWECVLPGAERANPLTSVGGVYKCVEQDGSKPVWELQP